MQAAAHNNNHDHNHGIKYPVRTMFSLSGRKFVGITHLSLIYPTRLLGGYTLWNNSPIRKNSTTELGNEPRTS
jgi:hypothetical protein